MSRLGWGSVVSPWFSWINPSSLHPVSQIAIKRANKFAPYADLVWLETKTPDLEQARSFARKIREQHPGKYVFSRRHEYDGFCRSHCAVCIGGSCITSAPASTGLRRDSQVCL